MCFRAIKPVTGLFCLIVNVLGGRHGMEACCWQAVKHSTLTHVCAHAVPCTDTHKDACVNRHMLTHTHTLTPAHSRAHPLEKQTRLDQIQIGPFHT